MRPHNRFQVGRDQSPIWPQLRSFSNLHSIVKVHLGGRLLPPACFLPKTLFYLGLDIYRILLKTQIF